MWKNSIISFVLLMVSALAFGQYGNEWIDPNKTYYKFKIAEDNFYRITREELQAIGFPVGTVPADRIQLFREGQEVALYVDKTAGSLNFLEFYGTKKDGTSDTPLYDAGDQPHTYYNLFSDSASYFLTYRLSGNGKRMGNSLDKNASGLTPEPYHLEDSIQVFGTVYSPGIQFGSESKFILSKYDEGETWTGNFQGKGAFKNFIFELENRTTDINTRMESVLVGGNSLAHNAAVSAGPSASGLVGLQNIQFNGRGVQEFAIDIPNASIGASGELTIRVLAQGFPNASERFSVAYVKVTYPQNLSMNANENKLIALDNISERKAWMQIATTNATNTRIFDVTDPFNGAFMESDEFSDRIEVVVPNVSLRNRFMAVTSPKSVGKIELVTLPNFDLSDKNYLIITHELLRTGDDPVNDYKVYRESDNGGGHAVQIAEVNDLYNLFGFGDPTPLAIRNFIRFASTQGPVDNVFIIGKGFTVNYDYFRGGQTAVNIPTFGLPGADLMYTLGIGTASDVPGIPIGRLNATNTSQVTAYLDKIIEMEALPFNDLFRKDFLQLSGGINEAELNAFASIIQEFTNTLEKDFIGGRAFNTGKETNESTKYIDVSDRVNHGVGYITFFGHSSGTVTDIEIGRVSNPQFGFSNKGKYPIFLVNGCQAGEIFGNNFTFGEDWMLTKDLGSVGFLAHTATALASTLRNWSNLFYRVGFADDEFIGKSIGEVFIEVSQRYYAQNGGNDLNLTQMQQMQLQGDPAYRVFGADSPDYYIDNNAITAHAIDADEILITQDSFRLDLVVKNFGRSVEDSLFVRVDRTYPDGSQDVYVEQFKRPLRQDTIAFFIPIESTKNNEGTNLLSVQLDPENTTTELSESNNTASIEVLIYSGNTFHLFPLNNGTQSNQQTTLTWQSSNPMEDNRSYDLELDTQSDFAGPNKRTFTVSGEVLMKQDFDFTSLSLADSTTIYWRTRFTNPEPDESNEWNTTSFTLIDNVADGWGQYTSDQLTNELVTGIEYNEGSNQWQFKQTVTPIDMFTFGGSNPILDSADVRAIIGGIDFIVTSNTRDPYCFDNTFNAIAFDKESGDPYRPIQTTQIDVFNNEVCGRLPQRIYQFDEMDMIGSARRFEVLVDNMRDGDMIVMFNIGDVVYSNWDANVEATLNAVGVSSATIASLTDGQPVIFFGRKGDAPGTATVVLNNGSGNPITEQSIDLQDDVFGSFTSGQIKTRRIGPANSWDSFSYNLSDEANDNFTLDLYGVSPDGDVNSLVSRARSETVDVTSIDPTLYPKLELVFAFDDVTDQTPPQLNFWEINYAYPPDGILLPETKDQLEFTEGEEISRMLRFINISNADFTDSLAVMARLVNQTQGTVAESSFKIAPPLAGDTTTFSVDFSSFEMDGLNSLVVEVMANENEAYSSNNRLTMTNLINVEADETNPILDVTFDGFHILDGDVVSPNPMISIKMRDDNPFATKTDTTGLHVSLKLPGDASQFERINFTDARLNYIPGSETQDFEIEYQPGPLDDGMHAIRVRAEDVSGNETGSEPYQINFEVINESTVTHFYPYPNPFSTNCRFVFTLTGSEVPDEIKIQIMTVSGRVVREITQDEIGPIRIGNNITSYAWDGRDEYGDQLANGVYFYKVFINSNGNELTHRATSADRAFKHGFGKLYILR